MRINKDGIHIGKWIEAVDHTDIAFIGDSNGKLLGYFTVTDNGWKIQKGNDTSYVATTKPQLANFINQCDFPMDGWTW